MDAGQAPGFYSRLSNWETQFQTYEEQLQGSEELSQLPAVNSEGRLVSDEKADLQESHAQFNKVVNAAGRSRACQEAFPR